jgi:transitional endoplasmic reticulum ATPase
LFDNPDQAERHLYARYWQNKLASNDSIEFSDQLVHDIASATSGFSFALLKEVFVSTLFFLATQDDDEDLEFEPLLRKTIKELADTIKKTRAPPAPARALGAAALPPSLEHLDEGMREELEARRTAQGEARDLRSMALAAARIGRRFI